jgi:vacuolar-type H+-ATPase subunit H
LIFRNVGPHLRAKLFSIGASQLDGLQYLYLMRASSTPGDQSKGDSDPVIGAIERVLQAERVAEQTLNDCRERARTILAAARNQAQEITRRADARISRVHTLYLHKVQEEIGKLLPAQEVENRASQTVLKDAISRLAAKLTGDAR